VPANHGKRPFALCQEIDLVADSLVGAVGSTGSLIRNASPGVGAYNGVVPNEELKT
jgi:hypothetical protein